MIVDALHHFLHVTALSPGKTRDILGQSDLPKCERLASCGAHEPGWYIPVGAASRTARGSDDEWPTTRRVSVQGLQWKSQIIQSQKAVVTTMCEVSSAKEN